MSECICKGNLRAIVSKTNHLLGKEFKRLMYDGGLVRYVFEGVMIGEDDYYYVMRNTRDNIRILLSCTGTLMQWGYVESEE